jgi:DNA-binding transcriptional regulator YhcF (GntR family)
MVTSSLAEGDAVQIARESALGAPADARSRRTVERIARIAGELLHAPLVRVYLCESANAPPRCCLGSEWEIPAADRLAADVWKLGKTDSLLGEGDEEWRAGLATPLRAGQEVRGVLQVLASEERLWSEEDRAWLEDVAASASAELELKVQRQTPAPKPAAPPRARHPVPPRPRQREQWSDSGSAADPSITTRLRAYVTGSIHRGHLRPGDRLPSIRSTATTFGVTPYSALQAYAVLESEGLVERRERSGIFVSQLELRAGRPLPETGAWLAEVVTQACEHQLKVPSLPDLIRRWTTAAPIRCLCVESCADYRAALCGELRRQFGIEASAVPLDELLRSWDAPPDPRGARLTDADLFVTTAYHAAEVRRVAVRLEMPLVIATVHPQSIEAAEEWLAEQALTVICADPVFGERLRDLLGDGRSERVRVVLADDSPALDALDRTEPVLLTPAARQRMRQADFRLVAPLSPAFSLDFARKISEVLVRLHIEAERA